MFENDETRAERELLELEAQQTAAQTAAHPQPAPEPQSQEKPAEGQGEKAPEPQKEDDGYKQRYQTLQGMMRAEREKWQTEKAALQRQLQELQNRPAQNDSVEVEEDYRSPHVSNEVRNSLAYRRMAELNGRRHTEIHFESMAMMQPKQEEKPQDGDFFTNLDRLARNWRQLNNDPAFLTFLGQVAPYSGGMTLQNKLDQAVQAQDAAAAAQFFIDFAETKHNPPTARTPEALVAPAKRGSSAQINAESHNGKVYTRAQWDDGWKQLELGSLSAKAAAALEADLTNAPSEGRVVG